MHGRRQNQPEKGRLCLLSLLRNSDGHNPGIFKPQIRPRPDWFTVGCQLNGLASSSYPGHEEWEKGGYLTHPPHHSCTATTWSFHLGALSSGGGFATPKARGLQDLTCRSQKAATATQSTQLELGSSGVVVVEWSRDSVASVNISWGRKRYEVDYFHTWAVPANCKEQTSFFQLPCVGFLRPNPKGQRIIMNKRFFTPGKRGGGHL